MTKTGDRGAGNGERKARLREESVAYASLSDDEAAVLNLESREFFTLNATARLVVESVEQGLSTKQIVARVAEEFAVDEQQALPDVERFLLELTAVGIIER